VRADNGVVSFSVSPQVRVLALVGILVAVAGGLAMMMLGHSSSSAPATHVIKPLGHSTAPGSHVTKPSVSKTVPAKPAVKKPVVTHRVVTPKPVTHKAVAPKPVTHKAVAHKVVAPKHVAKPKPVVHTFKVAANGLPKPVVAALQKHKVVVVALFEPNRKATKTQLARAQAGTSAGAAAGVDAMALAEAAAGAKDAKAGFVGVNVLSQGKAKPLAAVFGVTADPTVLVLTRVKHAWKLSVKLAGYADRTTVAQAASNSRP
jgi:hypothetical protein